MVAHAQGSPSAIRGALQELAIPTSLSCSHRDREELLLRVYVPVYTGILEAVLENGVTDHTAFFNIIKLSIL